MRRLVVALAVWIVTGVAGQAASFNIDGFGTITGATDVVVDGTSYDVEFVDGSCDSLFVNPSDGAPCDPDLFAFDGVNSAVASSLALIDLFSTTSTVLTRLDLEGCPDFSSTRMICNFFTPYGRNNSQVFLHRTQVFDNVGNQSGYSGLPIGNLNVSTGFVFSSPDDTYAVWTAQATAVPLPTGFALLLAAVFGLVGVRHSRSIDRSLIAEGKARSTLSAA
ncbi:MAG: hypothetical protein AAF401_05865 [Pseudomonadota bacterium]